jgi:(1->4)-alpha-D-glucan 1-alpha-D-glucosylmutase
VTAKGVEDTAFYRHLRLLALNEVGGDPERFGESVEAFHRAMADAPRRSLLATATHDTKRGEDVRMRLAVLSEMPDEWAAAVERLSALRPDVPDPHAAYFFYQTVVGAWPLEPDRAWAYLEKSVREAKRRTSWTRPDAAYEEALRAFVTGALGDPAFRAEVERFLSRILPAAQRNALAQTLIKLTAPGVGDIYQGTELWDLSLVDPDNRRPVDFDTRRRLLAELDGAERDAILARMDEGLPKLWVIRQALRVRARRPEAFAGAYRPLEVEGPQASHVVAFVRGEEEVAVAVPRLTATLENHPVATLTLPPGVWRNELTGDMVAGGPVSAGTLWDRFPVTLLSRES